MDKKTYYISGITNGTMRTIILSMHDESTLRNEVLDKLGYDIDNQNEYEQVAIIVVEPNGRNYIYTCSFDF